MMFEDDEKKKRFIQNHTLILIDLHPNAYLNHYINVKMKQTMCCEMSGEMLLERRKKKERKAHGKSVQQK